jgi:mannose-P-dolichol utilization defect protein 1
MDLLRSVVQPITHNLPKPIADLGTSLIGPACYKTLLLDVDPTQTECLKLAVSKGLGIAIIGASSVVKIPQILKLINSQSAEGLSFLSYLLESGAYLISLSYNVRHGFPFSTYGETALILIQNIAIASLVLKYSDNNLGIAAWIGGLMAAGAALFNENLIGDERLSLLQATAGVLGVASKVPQILTIWTEGGTGQLSAFAVSSCPLSSRGRSTNTYFLGRQLPSRLSHTYFHHAPGGRRPAHPLWLYCRLRAQPRPLPPGCLLLERACFQEH